MCPVPPELRGSWGCRKLCRPAGLTAEGRTAAAGGAGAVTRGYLLSAEAAPFLRDLSRSLTSPQDKDLPLCLSGSSCVSPVPATCSATGHRWEEPGSGLLPVLLALSPPASSRLRAPARSASSRPCSTLWYVPGSLVLHELPNLEVTAVPAAVLFSSSSNVHKYSSPRWFAVFSLYGNAL